MIRMIVVFLLMCSLSNAVLSASDHLYQVSLLRAAPGNLPTLIEQVQQRKAEVKNNLLIMRHSQGDHWDLMLLQPFDGGMPRQHDYQPLADFQHDFLARSEVDWDTLQEQSTGANLFHIEMFQALHGAYADLLEQRKMENNYLVATQRTANIIFETVFGSDVDIFTLGIYSDLQAFAAEPDLKKETFEKAATVAGFKSRSDIGFYLRQFLVGHQDTLATQVE